MISIYLRITTYNLSAYYYLQSICVLLSYNRSRKRTKICVGWSVLVVKWLACSPSALTIVQFSVKLLLKRMKLNKKEAEVGPFYKDVEDVMLVLIVLWLCCFNPTPSLVTVIGLPILIDRLPANRWWSLSYGILTVARKIGCFFIKKWAKPGLFFVYFHSFHMTNIAQIL